MTSCAVVRQDQVGVKRKLGRLTGRIISPGVTLINPFTTTVLRLPNRTVNLEVELDLPSKEGLTIRAEVSILYHIDPTQAVKIVTNSGLNYERTVILPVFRSAVADVSSRFFAKDMHTAQRAVIEIEVQEHMSRVLSERGFIIESVLMKRVQLPAGLSRAIEEKLQAEQESQRMEFILTREKLEAERRKIEAAGVRDAQRIINEGLTPLIIQYMSIEALRELSKSNNTKTIFIDSKSPFLINPER
ncbi:prohibitin family protein [Eisenibacter elegans]|jgi:regulator of protease activity HflC (stomatin/prohibitin superfamily)|uniref:prohibitin family protein n=1 Tax=Eisenibacter elegans TaxID=997 RepID=UPI0006850B1B|nr:prohibitin family protein [Eisenibacter elegans]